MLAAYCLSSFCRRGDNVRRNSACLSFSPELFLLLYGRPFLSDRRHRDYFLPVASGNEDAHAPPPSNRTTIASACLLLVALVAVVGLAKFLTPNVEAAVTWLGVPKGVVGIVIAALVLLPEGLAAVRAASANRLQTSLNLALGSSLATIGLTIPAVAVVSVAINQPLELVWAEGPGSPVDAWSVIASHRSDPVLQGVVHLVIFDVRFLRSRSIEQ